MSERLQAIRAAQNESAPKITVESDADDDESSNESIESGVNGNESSEEENEAEITEDAIEEVADEENHKSEQMLFSCEALGDFVGEEPDDLSFSKGDMLTIISMRADGWWKAEDQYGHKGMIPSSFLKVPDKIQKYLDGNVAASANLEKGLFWEKLRNTVKQSHHIEEAITCMGALPVGFCHSSLKQLIDKDSKYSTEAFLIPKYSDSGLLFRDLHWSSNTNTLKSITTQLQRCVRLVALRQVCLPASGFEISSHHVRICLHDGSKVLSNIHTIRAKFDPKTPKIWTFAPKLPPNGSSLEEGTFFVRSNAVSPTIGVLFQLSLSFTKVATKETGEMSCGWVFMRLLDDSGLAVPNRNRILRIHGGVPFLNLNNSPSFTGNKNGPLKLFMNRGKTPRLVVSLSTLKRKYDQLLNFLPETLIGPISSIPLLVLYRKILADKLLKDRASFDCTELVQSPFLINFINAFEQPDVMDAFRKCWSEKTKKLKQSDSKDEENKKKSFQQLFIETAFLILHCNTLPGYAFGNTQVEKVRKIEIQRIMKLIKEHGPLAVAMSSDYQFQPLSVRKLSLDVIGQHCFPVDGVE